MLHNSGLIDKLDFQIMEMQRYQGKSGCQIGCQPGRTWILSGSGLLFED
jgi:hypothetical protein